MSVNSAFQGGIYFYIHVQCHLGKICYVNLVSRGPILPVLLSLMYLLTYGKKGANRMTKFCPTVSCFLHFFFTIVQKLGSRTFFFLLFLWRLSRVLSKIHKGFALSLVTHLLTLQSQSSYGLVETLTGEFKRQNLCQIQKCICFTFLTFRDHRLPPQIEMTENIRVNPREFDLPSKQRGLRINRVRNRKVIYRVFCACIIKALVFNIAITSVNCPLFIFSVNTHSSYSKHLYRRRLVRDEDLFLVSFLLRRDRGKQQVHNSTNVKEPCYSNQD